MLLQLSIVCINLALKELAVKKKNFFPKNLDISYHNLTIVCYLLLFFIFFKVLLIMGHVGAFKYLHIMKQ